MVEDSENVKPDVYAYHDYREFLADLFQFLKSSENGFSLRQFAKQCGISHSIISYILSNKRSMSATIAKKMSACLGIPPAQQQFFKYMVQLSDADSQEERDRAYRKMNRHANYRIKNKNDIEAYAYLNHWYLPAIREMSALPDFKLEPKWIRERLKVKIPLSKIKQSLEFLTEKGFIQFNEDKSVKVPDKMLDCSGGIYRLSLTNYQDEIFQLAQKSISNTQRDSRHISGHTVAISEKNIKQLKNIMEEFSKKIEELAEKNQDRDEVYQISLAAFPLTNKTEL